MKQIKLILITAVLVSALFWSCKDSTELTNAIPTDAIVVIHVDTKSLLTKADYKPLDNKLIKEAFEKEKNRGGEQNKAIFEKMEEFLKNPNSSGIDLIHDCYMYVGNTSMGIIWGMKDAAKFKEFLTKTFNLPTEMIKEEDGISMIDLPGIAKVGWTKDKILIITVPASVMYGFGQVNQPNMTELLKKQLKQTGKESLNSNKAFTEFVKDKKDISFFYSYSNVLGLWGNMTSQMMGAYGGPSTAGNDSIFSKLSDQIKGINAAGFISFEKGEIVAENKFYYDTPEAEKRYTDMVGKLTQELKGDQMKFLVDKPLFLAATGIKGGGIYDYLADLGFMQFVENIAGSNLKEIGIDLKSLISNINGDISISINGIKTIMKKDYYDYEYPSTEPEFSAFADLKDAKPTWDLIRNKVKEEAAKEQMLDSTLVEIDESTYSFVMDEGMKGYVGIKGNTIYITNSESIYKNISTATDAKNDFAQLAKGKNTFIFGNLSLLKSMFIGDFQGDSKVQEFVTKGFDLLGDYSFAAGKDMNGKGKIIINDNSANSLAVICKYIDSIITYAIERNQ
jgi:hypothetical protein